MQNLSTPHVRKPIELANKNVAIVEKKVHAKERFLQRSSVLFIR